MHQLLTNRRRDHSDEEPIAPLFKSASMTRFHLSKVTIRFGKHTVLVPANHEQELVICCLKRLLLHYWNISVHSRVAREFLQFNYLRMSKILPR